MTLMYTCELNGVDAFAYLNALQLNAGTVANRPGDWMPWNYPGNVKVIPAETTDHCAVV